MKPHRRELPIGARFTSKPVPYLEARTTVRVRFNEVDTLRIVWHGHYVNFFEEGRRAWGRQYGLDYPVFIAHNTPAPVVALNVDYFMPARLEDTLEVTTRALKAGVGKLEFAYEIRREGGGPLLAVGRTLQVFTNLAGELLLAWPPFMMERLKAWEPLWQDPDPATP